MVSIFEPTFFEGKTVLDAGCGTGDISLIFADYGAQVHGFDLNDVSVEHARFMADQFELKAQTEFRHGTVYRPPFQDEYDFVICRGVLPHVGDPEKAFNTLAERIAPGGYFYVSTINTYGYILRALKRVVVQLLALGNPENVAHYARVIWREHIRRAAKYGQRTEEQVTWDNFVAPHTTATINEWLRWMENNNLEYISSFPSFYSLKMPAAKTGGNELMDTTLGFPRNEVKRKIMPILAQLRWAMAFGVGGKASIDFVCRRGGN